MSILLKVFTAMADGAHSRLELRVAPSVFVEVSRSYFVAASSIPQM